MFKHRLMCLCAALALVSSPVVADELEEAASLSPSMLGKVGSGAHGKILDSLHVSGSAEVGYTYNFNNTTSGVAGNENVVRYFDTRHNEFTHHNTILSISSPASESQTFGFALTPTFGNDGNGTDLAGRFGGDLDVLDANIQAHVMGADIKVGKFQTRVGGEVISPTNPNYSRSFLFSTIPFTHTGFEVAKGFSQREDGGDMFTAVVGLSNGWDNAVDANDSFLAMTTLTIAPSQVFDVTINWFFGADGRGAGGAADNADFGNLIDIIANVDLGEIIGVEGLSFAGNLDWYGSENANSYADYYGFAGILSYTCDAAFTEASGDSLLFALRGEYFDDADGFITGAPASLWDITGTVGYRPSDWFLVRLEVRHDKADVTAFQNGTRHQQTTVAVSTVFTF